MRKITITFSILLSFVSISLFSQTAPQAEPVYGGYVEQLDNIPLSATTTRVFASTMSPNSLFYADITNVNTASPTFTNWSIVPDLDQSGSYGHLGCFAVDENSGFVFAATQAGNFIGVGTTIGSSYLIEPIFVEAVEAYNSVLLWQLKKGNQEWMYVADIMSTGSLTNIDSTLIATSPGWLPTDDFEIHINPKNQHVYFYVPGQTPQIYKSSDIYTNITNSTTWSTIGVSSIAILNKDYVSMGIAKDGRIYAGSYTGNSSSFTAQVSYTDVDGDPWNTITFTSDCGRGDFAITDTNAAGDYNVFFGRVYSQNKGATWAFSGAADGAISADPINLNYAYVRTDWGVGRFENYTPSVIEINDGLQAVQVNDFAMNYSKDTAWVASKSGIWHVGGYGGTSPSWSSPIWPDGMTVPWTEVETKTYADPLYCGNTNGDVYKWTASYGSLNLQSSYQRIFDGHTSFPNYTWTYGVYNSAIAVDLNSTNERVFVGLYDAEDWNETEAMGGVFVGEYSGPGWTFTQISSSPMISDGCDVNDIVAVYESGKTVAYIGVERNTNFTGTVNGIYRIEETTLGNWTPSNDLFTGPGVPISATIMDLTVSPMDTIYACGTDASGTSIVTYKKAIGGTYWIALPQSGLPSQGVAKSITVDNSTFDIYIAVENEIFGLPAGGGTWSKVWTYALGTAINFIYYDDLLVGTGTGLYAHWSNVGLEKNKLNNYQAVKVFPNPFKNYINFQFDLSKGQKVDLIIYDINGKEIRTIIDACLTKNSYNIIWNGMNDHGVEVCKGTYMYKLTVGEKTYSGRIVK